MSYHMHLCWKWFESRNQTWGFYHRCKVSSRRRNDEESEGNFAQGAKDDDFQTALITLEWILKCKENLKSQLLSGKYSLFRCTFFHQLSPSLMTSWQEFFEHENEFIRSSKLSFHAMKMTNKKLIKWRKKDHQKVLP